MADSTKNVPGTQIPRPRIKLTGTNGNAFAVMAAVRRALRKAHVPQTVIDKYIAESTSGDYSHLLVTAYRYARVS